MGFVRFGAVWVGVGVERICVTLADTHTLSPPDPCLAGRGLALLPLLLLSGRVVFGLG